MLAVTLGSAGPAPVDLWRGLLAGTDPLAHELVVSLRLPRALTAFAAGALLATSGVFMQVLLRNPLADPYVLGVSGGAAVGALAAMLAGLAAILVQASAALGALAATLAVFSLAHGRGGWTPTRLLLTGVVVAAGCGALVSLLLALGEEARLRGMLFWLMGDIGFAASPGPLLLLTAVAIPFGMLIARSLNVLARGDLQATTLGVAVRPLRIGIYVVSSILTAATVTTVGSIGFVGLVTPHLVRQLTGADHRLLVPAAALSGGALLVLADTLARTALAPRQLPVGALTALVGVPLFLVLMSRGRQVG